MPPPRSDARWSTGKWIAAIFAVAINLAFVAFLVFSVTWQNRKPEAVSVELYAAPLREKADTPKPKPPEPEPVKPPPEPPKPEPAKPPPKVEPPQPAKADIALKEKRELERKKQEQLEREKIEKRERDADKRKTEEKRVAEARERQTREADALKAQAERERRAIAQAAEAAQARANDDYVRQIQAKIRALVVVPPDISGNPEAIFDVVQLPTGEIIDTQLRKSSGVRAYDDAVQRAIIRASPLPQPKSADSFRRNLTLKFRPLD